MEILILLIPIIACIILFIFYRSKVNIIEYLAILGSCTLVYFIYYYVDEEVSQSDTEYLGDYITKIRHEDDWDEWVKKTCSRRVPAGRNSNGGVRYMTKYYDCSYRSYHPDSYYMYPNNSSRISISKSEFNRLKIAWKTPERFVDMKRRYFKIDGDAHEFDWNKNPIHSRTVTFTNLYDNPILGSKTTIYRNIKISDSDIKEYELVDYPDIKGYDQENILGRHWVPDYVRKKWKFINGFYGKSHQIRTYIIFYKNKTSEAADKQISYWKGGNKNELIIMMGIDEKTKLQWVKVHSWSDNPEFETRLDTHISSYIGRVVDMNELYNFYIDNVNSWNRKEFKDFEYIQHTMSPGSMTALSIIILIITVVGSIIVVTNELDLIGWRNKRR